MYPVLNERSKRWHRGLIIAGRIYLRGLVDKLSGPALFVFFINAMLYWRRS